MSAEERGGGRGREERKRGHIHTDQKTTVLLCAHRTDAAVSSHWEWGVKEGGREDWLLPARDATLTPRPRPPLFSALPFSPACAEPHERTVSQHRRSTEIRKLAQHIVPPALQLALPPFHYSPSHVHTRNALAAAHWGNFLSHVHTCTLTSEQAGGQEGTPPPPPIICAAGRSARIGVSSTGLCSAPQQQQQQQQQQDESRGEQSSPEITHQPPQRRVSLPLLPLLPLFLSLFPSSFSPSWCDAVFGADLPSSSPPPFFLSPQCVPVGQPWRTPSPAATPPSPRCLDARGSSCKPVSSLSHSPPAPWQTITQPHVPHVSVTHLHHPILNLIVILMLSGSTNLFLRCNKVRVKIIGCCFENNHGFWRETVIYVPWVKNLDDHFKVFVFHPPQIFLWLWLQLMFLSLQQVSGEQVRLINLCSFVFLGKHAGTEGGWGLGLWLSCFGGRVLGMFDT